ncbi:cytidine deaminase [Trueperella pyogenes]|uniref:cytidine deaminase n=1 Tax=Trueperella pyogenes TaxID=1661 RepID=UPI00043B12A7|nr:cytidine deaminase [Trueperella pyogenes]AHU89291.1 cytidine deaminase [Trueperella pyogenes]AZR01966.1 cytidine deaminase [Trueperella pyogenes]OQD38502.1 cytidine deaminase [Trueperella pyogenes]UVJ53133.1 cytidine deaminase [Trueperella pyogenes]WHU59746.1 cytidine deaminase [Trueperella pyogenes]
MNIDWDALKELAIDAMKSAYAPYSGYPVGAAGVTTDGRYVSGCNVENASLGLGTCAENGMISALVRSGGGQLAAVWCVNGNGETIVPCGRCRQLLFEFGGPDLLVNMPEGGPQPMTYVLPQAFGPRSLTEFSGSAGNVDLSKTIF